MQAVLTIQELPMDGLSASRAFHDRYFIDVTAMLDKDANEALVIALPTAGPEHDDWRRTLARDLARTHTPKRINVVGAAAGAARDAIIAYLEKAPGVTGQYFAAHE